ncbi:PREDICTED: uncharacterized protein LOC104778957 [Camelina sativa]|uniref:Uncharacterized protein LOC104778957 n=1 Tax=Camelina sativa TaxID=90675 RepID=A0ABM0YIZ4_CAMSA|nr:PREDICTED: uncharacterized protein LOC104778957 [Camelina sativa]
MYHVLNVASLYPHREDLDRVVPWILWRLMNCRNDYVFNGKDFNAHDTVEKALEDADEWNQRNESEHSTNEHPLPRRTEDAKWEPPPKDWVKCNTDGTWSRAGTISGTGWVLRNEYGDGLWVGAQAIRCAISVMEVELEAMRAAISSMLRLNYGRVIFESDSLGMVNLLNSEEIWPISAPLLQDIKSLLPSFQAFQMVYMPRVCNNVADRIAKESLSLGNYDPSYIR